MFNGITYHSIRIAIILRKISGRFVFQQVARILAYLSYILLRQRRKILTENLRHIARGETRLVRETFINFGLAYADFLAIPSMNSKEICRIAKVRGLANLDRALSGGKGVVLVSAHLGNWDLEACYITALGYKTVGIAESLGPGKRFFNLYSRLRTKTGMKIIRLEDKRCGMEALKALRRNEALMLLGDRDITGNGVKVNFLGQEVSLPKDPALLSLKTGAPIVTAFFVRDNGKYTAIIEPPIEFKRCKILEKDIQNLTQLTAKRLERKILAYPTQWYVFQMDWREQANNHENRYCN